MWNQKWLKICLQYLRFWLQTWFNPTNQLWKFHHGLYGFYSLGWELNCACPLFKRALILRHVSRGRKQQKLRALLPVVHRPCLLFFIGPRLKHMFERSLELFLRIPKWFNAFEVLKGFSFLLKVTCVIFSRAIDTDVWQAIVARAIESQENCSKSP